MGLFMTTVHSKPWAAAVSRFTSKISKRYRYTEWTVITVHSEWTFNNNHYLSNDSG